VDLPAPLGPRGETDVLKALVATFVREADGLEPHLPRPRLQFRRVRRVRHIGLFVEQREHLLHVDGGLLDLAIGHPENVQRRIEIEHDEDDGGDVARAHPAAGHENARTGDHHGEADVHDEALRHVERDERGVGLHRRLRIACQRPVEAGAFAILGGEGLHGLEVQERIHRTTRRLTVALVHLAAVLQAPVGDAEGDYGVDRHGRCGDGRKLGPVLPREHARRERELDDGGRDVESEKPQQEVDGAHAALYDAVERACPFGLVEAHRERVDVREHRGAGAPLRLLADGREDGVADLRTGRGGEPQRRPESHEPDEHRQRAARVTLRQPVDAVRQHQRRKHRDHLAGERESERRPDPELHARRVEPADELQDAPDGLPYARGVGLFGLNGGRVGGRFRAGAHVAPQVGPPRRARNAPLVRRRMGYSAAMKAIQSVCVYCGSSNTTKPEYLDLATRVGEAIALRGMRMVYGGGRVGLMGRAAEACHKNGGEVLGVMPKFLGRREITYEDVPHRMVDTMHERKLIMFNESDAFLVLPGGIGTLEEAIEMLSWRRLDLHVKPLVFLSEDGFWDPLFHLMQHTIDTNLTPPSFNDVLLAANNVEDAFRALERRMPA
jgi:uncharacterized protein (TIGR00730 family)